LQLAKDTWPECIQQHMLAEVCKEFIDDEIQTLFTGVDQYITSKIRWRREETDPWYNTLDITMDDNNLVVGKDGDGVVHYEL